MSPGTCQSAPWIQIDRSYSFRLYEGTAHVQQIDAAPAYGVPACDNDGICEPQNGETELNCFPDCGCGGPGDPCQ